MKILISGGTGFVGQHVAEHYLKAGHTVYVTGREAPVPGAEYLGRGIATAVACIIVGILLLANGVVTAGVVLALGAAAIAGVRVYVLYSTVPDAPPGQPEILTLTGDGLRLLEAGSPIGLLQNAVRLTGPFRAGDETRMSHDGPTKLDRNTYASFQGYLAFESKPTREPTNPEQTRAAERLEYTAVAVSLVGLGIMVLVNPTSTNVALKFIGLVVMLLCASMFRTALCLRNTFRFRSDLVGIWFDGNYQYQKGGLHGPRSAEVELVKSDITAVIAGTQVISECTLGHRIPTSGGKRQRANVEAARAARSALESPRYVVRTAVDDDFRSRLDAIAALIMGYRDAFRDVVGLNLDSPEAQRISQTNAPARPSGAMTPAVEKMLADAMRVYYNPSQSDDAKALAKQMVNQIKQAKNLRSAQLAEIAKRVRAELGTRESGGS